MNSQNKPDAESRSDSPSGSPSDSLIGGWRRVLFLSLAGLFFVLGVLGAVLPGLPATPFLLLTSYFLVRTSPALNERLLNSRLVGPILRDWQQKRGVRRDVKIQAVVCVMIAVGLSIYLAGNRGWLTVGIALAASVGIAVILRLKTVE